MHTKPHWVHESQNPAGTQEKGENEPPPSAGPQFNEEKGTVAGAHAQWNGNRDVQDGSEDLSTVITHSSHGPHATSIGLWGSHEEFPVAAGNDGAWEEGLAAPAPEKVASPSGQLLGGVGQL